MDSRVFPTKKFNKMNKSTVQKCRTCLKSSANTVPLTRHAIGCNPMRTYGQLLQEYANVEFIADYEGFMPQYLCSLCSHQLRNTCAFIKQAQYCNNKLINVISKKLDCLKERTIDLPENANDTDKNLERTIDLPENANDFEQNLKIKEERTIDEWQNPEIDEFSLGVLNKEEQKNMETADRNNDVENILKVIEIDENDSNDDLRLQCSTTTEIKEVIPSLEVNTDKTQIDSSVCPICEKMLSSHDDVIKHVRIQHDIENPSKLFHKPKLEEELPLECSLTTESNKNIANLTDNTHDSLIKYLRIQYDVENPSDNVHKPKLREIKAKQIQRNKMIKCRLCNYIAGTYASLNYHKRSKHGSEKDKFKCNFCSNMYFQKFLLLKHMKTCHKDEIKSLKAKEEIKGGTKTDTTTENNILNRQMNELLSPASSHTETEEEKEKFSDEEFIRNIVNIKKRQTKFSSKHLARRCDECGNIYKDQKALSIHKKYVHISEDKYSLCPHCGKKYKRKTDLRIHIENKHIEKSKTGTKIARPPPKAREKRFMCTECSYVCSTIAILNIHVNRHHTGERPYKCDICFKTFIVRYDLKIHRYLHTGERPYKCPICYKGFRDNSHMVKHKRIHSSERPYKCKECNKSFAVSYNLSVHRRTHLKQQKLNCIVCGKVFENRSLLNMHRINENHQDEDI